MPHRRDHDHVPHDNARHAPDADDPADASRAVVYDDDMPPPDALDVAPRTYRERAAPAPAAPPRDEEPVEPVEVPHDALAPATLDRLLADVALRDDTDYGDHPLPLDERVARARAALERGELVVTFDPRSETAAVVPAKHRRTPR